MVPDESEKSPISAITAEPALSSGVITPPCPALAAAKCGRCRPNEGATAPGRGRLAVRRRSRREIGATLGIASGRAPGAHGAVSQQARRSAALRRALTARARCRRDGVQRTRVLLVFRHRDTTKSTEPAAERPLLAVDVQRSSVPRAPAVRTEKNRKVGRLRGRWWLGAGPGRPGLRPNEDAADAGPDGLAEEVGQAY